MKNTLKQAVCSMLVLVMTVSALLGTTFAWFTDIVSSNGNVIASGNLDAAMEWSDDLSTWTDASSGPIFNYNKWEPGYTEVKYIRITNGGNLNFKWKLSIEAEGKVTDLSDVIDVYYIKPAETLLSKEQILGGSSVGSLTDVLANSTGVSSTAPLTPGSSLTLAIAFHMREEAGNEYQEKELCSGGFAIKLLATQGVGEFDSFDDQYDVDAEWPYSAIRYSVPTSISDKLDPTTGMLTEDVSIGDPEDTVSAEIPADIKLADGADKLILNVTSMERPEADVAPANRHEIIRSVDVHIDGVADDNTVPMIITLKALFPAGITSNNVKLYHVENGSTNEMTLVDNPVNHNEFKLDSNTGDVVIAVASFSEIATLADTSNPWDGETVDTDWYNETDTEFTLKTPAQLAGFRDLVDGGNTFEGKTVKLGADINLGNKNFDPIGWGYDYSSHNRDGAAGKTFKGSFDGAGFVIQNLYQNGWDLESTTGTDYTYTNCGGGLFASATNATIKNLTILGANIVYECVEIGIVVGIAQGSCTFENIQIYNAKIANYQRPAGGIVGEVSPTLDANGSAIACTHTFKDIVIDTSVTVGSLWGDFDTPVGGVIGARWDDADVSDVVMDNVNVACKLDVYNDVTSTYQWYAYRRAGMLIGNTDTPPADGKNSKIATADFLSCNNVKVYYSNWTKYNYCQFSNYNSSWPWVRVQPGDNCSAYSNPRYGVPKDVNDNLVVDYNHAHKDGDQCNVELEFNQLYGGGQGVYGQPEHEGVTFVKYTITFMHDDHIADIQFITDNSAEHTVEFPELEDLNENEYNWINYIGEVVTPGSEKIAADNIRDVVYYVNIKDKLYARFVDKDGVQIDAVEFHKGDSELSRVPAVPEIPGYNGVWEPYDKLLEEAEADIIINPVYIIDSNATVLTSAEELFSELEAGKSIAMSQDLKGAAKNASKNIFCDIKGNKQSRVDLNSFVLDYNEDSSANKEWTLFKVASGSSLTIGSGIYGYGTLTFNLNKLNSNAKPCLFDLTGGGTLVLERGVTIKLSYPDANASSVIIFNGISNIEDFLIVTTTSEGGITTTQIVVTARTVLVGE